MSTSCLDARTADLGAAPGRGRAAAGAARPARPAGLSRWTRLAVRAQWGPWPADAVRLDAGVARGPVPDEADGSVGSLAAWAAARRASSVRRRARSGKRGGEGPLASTPVAAVAGSSVGAAAGAHVAAVAGSSVAAVAGALAALVRATCAPLRAWRRARRVEADIAALRELDARMLRDLGIERADIERVARGGGGPRVR